MKKILFFAFSLLVSIASIGQNSLKTDSLQAVETDSISAGMQQFSSKLEDVTKAEGDSAYMRNDYISAIQISTNITITWLKLQMFTITLGIVIIKPVILPKQY